MNDMATFSFTCLTGIETVADEKIATYFATLIAFANCLPLWFLTECRSSRSLAEL